jgi:hypothetical protein
VFDAGYLRSGCLLSRIVGRGLDLEWVSSNKSSSQDMIYFLLTFSPSKTTKVKKWNLQGFTLSHPKPSASQSSERDPFLKIECQNNNVSGSIGIDQVARTYHGAQC